MVSNSSGQMAEVGNDQKVEKLVIFIGGLGYGVKKRKKVQLRYIMHCPQQAKNAHL